MHPKNKMLKELSALIKIMLAMRYRGGEYSRLAHAQGLVGGYMQALIDSGLVSHDDIMELVREQRVIIDGPSVRAIHLDEIEATAAA